ncbi:MAG: hypothetical protein CENE_00633 [Candidatus Celerinatantimonas neptuna]|nr:MAG: hypothetical protein CENE_00633 [Candidatus Celerinatantimonas neptuna]
MNSRACFLLQQMDIPVWEERHPSQIMNEWVIVHENPESLMRSPLLQGILQGFSLGERDFQLIRPAMIEQVDINGPVLWFAEQECPSYLARVLFCIPWSLLRQDSQVKQQLWKKGYDELSSR